MTQNNFNYVSIIGFSYLDPIAILVEKLMSLKKRGPNEVKASQPENGLSSSIIVLSVLLLESAIARVKFESKSPELKGAFNFMKTRYPSFKKLGELEELFVIRDTIVHNHIWEARFSWDDEAGMRLLAAEIWEGSGDKKLNNVLNKDTRKTKTLGLNLFPTRISTNDAQVVLREVFSFLQFIEENGSQFINTSNQYVEFCGDYILFEEFVNNFVNNKSECI